MIFWAALLSFPPAFSQEFTFRSPQQANQELERVRMLVQAGALPPAKLAQAELAFADFSDSELLRKILFSGLTIEQLTKDQADQMVAAAERQLDRQQTKAAGLSKLVEQGVLARAELAPVADELESRRRTLQLAQTRAHLLEELAAMAKAEAAHADKTESARPGLPLAQRYEGNGVFSDSDFRRVEKAFEKRFLKPLPVSAYGETALHRALGFDHRGRIDVALNPDQPEGVWLRDYLEHTHTPYFAFRAAIEGQATAPHIHIGTPSSRYVSAD